MTEGAWKGRSIMGWNCVTSFIDAPLFLFQLEASTSGQSNSSAEKMLRTRKRRNTGKENRDVADVSKPLKKHEVKIFVALLYPTLELIQQILLCKRHYKQPRSEPALEL